MVDYLETPAEPQSPLNLNTGGAAGEPAARGGLPGNPNSILGPEPLLLHRTQRRMVDYLETLAEP